MEKNNIKKLEMSNSRKVITQTDSHDTMKFALIKIRYMRSMQSTKMNYDKMLMTAGVVYFARSKPDSMPTKVSGTK